MSRDDRPGFAPLTNPNIWASGEVWIRTRSGPTTRAHTPEVSVSTWHRVGSIDEYEGRIRTACGFGPRAGFLWPSGGMRLEIARPGPFGGLPGSVCHRCVGEMPIFARPERETLIADEGLDDLADAVARRLVERAEQQRGAKS